MKIETKFNIGDTVYFIYNNKIVSEKVYKLYVEKERGSSLSIKYGFEFQYDYAIINEGNCFVTKEELIKSL